MTASPGQGAFRTTRWSVLRAAGGTGEPARAALDEVARTYWYPLYAYGRRLGADREAAMDLVQGFFARLLERGGTRTLRFEEALEFLGAIEALGPFCTVTSFRLRRAARGSDQWRLEKFTVWTARRE